MNGSKASVVSYSLSVGEYSLSAELHLLGLRRHSLSVSVSVSKLLEYGRMFIEVFNDVGDIFMISNILRNINTTRSYKGVLYRLGKDYMWRWLINTFLACVNCI